MPSKNRIKPTKGRAMPGGKGPAGLRAWGYDGLQRVTSWLKEMRRTHGLKRLAELSGVSEGSLRNICDGDREPTPEMATKIATAIGVELDAIVKGRAA